MIEYRLLEWVNAINQQEEKIMFYNIIQLNQKI